MVVMIYGKYQGETEIIDEAEDHDEADELVAEYKMAYGRDWDIWKD